LELWLLVKQQPGHQRPQVQNRLIVLSACVDGAPESELFEQGLMKVHKGVRR
jgi:hypothetical protein